MMVKNIEGENRLRRKQELKRRLEEIKDRLPAMVANVEKRLVTKRTPRPGLIFLANAAQENLDMDQETTPSLMLLQEEGIGLWACCKISIETSNLGPFDLLLDPGEWTGGFPILLEAWNTVSIHRDDMQGSFFDEVEFEWVRRAQELFGAYQRSGEVPEHLLEFTGLPLKDDDIRWRFRKQEMDTMERIRLHYHEELQAEEDLGPLKIAYAASESEARVTRVSETLWEIAADVPIHPVRPQPSSIVYRDAASRQEWRSTLLEQSEEVPFSAYISQEQERVYLRIYLHNGEGRPDSIHIQGLERQAEEKGKYIEVFLENSEFLPARLDIRIHASQKEFVFQVAFKRETWN